MTITEIDRPSIRLASGICAADDVHSTATACATRAPSRTRAAHTENVLWRARARRSPLLHRSDTPVRYAFVTLVSLSPQRTFTRTRINEVAPLPCVTNATHTPRGRVPASRTPAAPAPTAPTRSASDAGDFHHQPRHTFCVTRLTLGVRVRCCGCAQFFFAPSTFPQVAFEAVRCRSLSQALRAPVRHFRIRASQRGTRPGAARRPIFSHPRPSSVITF